MLRTLREDLVLLHSVVSCVSIQKSILCIAEVAINPVDLENNVNLGHVNVYLDSRHVRPKKYVSIQRVILSIVERVVMHVHPKRIVSTVHANNSTVQKDKLDAVLSASIHKQMLHFVEAARRPVKSVSPVRQVHVHVLQD